VFDRTDQDQHGVALVGELHDAVIAFGIRYDGLSGELPLRAPIVLMDWQESPTLGSLRCFLGGELMDLFVHAARLVNMVHENQPLSDAARVSHFVTGDLYEIFLAKECSQGLVALPISAPRSCAEAIYATDRYDSSLPPRHSRQVVTLINDQNIRCAHIRKRRGTADVELAWRADLGSLDSLPSLIHLLTSVAHPYHSAERLGSSLNYRGANDCFAAASRGLGKGPLANGAEIDGAELVWTEDEHSQIRTDGTIWLRCWSLSEPCDRGRGYAWRVPKAA